jgi:hypothetical protein
MQKEWDDQLKDPNDFFFEAKKREDDIKKNRKVLQGAFDRTRAKKKQTVVMSPQYNTYTKKPQ